MTSPRVLNLTGRPRHALLWTHADWAQWKREQRAGVAPEQPTHPPGLCRHCDALREAAASLL